MTANSHRIHAPWSWPNHARAAVSLTYDDGRMSHLDLAIPELEIFQFRGTFYLTNDNPFVAASVDRWRAAASRGHEIGNHTFTHPTWEVLSGYDANDILADVGYGALWLKRIIGPDPNRSFAYPGGALGIGEAHHDRDSYTTAISRYHNVARGAGGPPNDPRDVRLPITTVNAALFDTPHETQLDDLRDYCEVAIRNGYWAIMMFHDVVGADYSAGDSQIGQNVHRRFLSYLKVEPYWVAPVREVANYIFQHNE